MSYLALAKSGKRRELSELSEERVGQRGLSSHHSLNSQRYLRGRQKLDPLLAAERIIRSPEALEDEADVMLRGGVA
jgi:hypothetical protein